MWCSLAENKPISIYIDIGLMLKFTFLILDILQFPENTKWKAANAWIN
jgi:hypothetical protein